jgi:hypothetical protein
VGISKWECHPSWIFSQIQRRKDAGSAVYSLFLCIRQLCLSAFLQACIQSWRCTEGLESKWLIITPAA